MRPVFPTGRTISMHEIALKRVTTSTVVPVDAPATFHHDPLGGMLSRGTPGHR